jgi:RNA polymerase sigma-70 factor (ECF subfamily)
VVDVINATAPAVLVEPAEPDAEFVARLLPLLPLAHRLAHGMLRDTGEAEDAVQEAILKAWRAFGRLRTDSDVKAWFLTIVANQCRTQRRSRWWSIVRRAELSAVAGDDPTAGSSDALELRRALGRLSPDQRLLLVLRYYLDLSYEEVGKTFAISSQAAKSRVHRALVRLRIEVGEGFDDA